jgi:hypothetical protein
VTFPAGEDIAVVTRTKAGRNAYGDDVFTETTVTVTGAFAPAIGYELTGAGDTVVAQPQAYLPAGTAVTAASVLVIRGDRYEVDGEPADWRDPFDGWTPGIAVPLRRVTG